jgi:hypothetical protein
MGWSKKGFDIITFLPGNRFVSWWIRNPAFQGEVAASATIPPISDARALGWRLLEQVSMSLRVSVEELRALGEVTQAVNSTLDLETVLTTIVAKAVQLSGTPAVLR